MSTSKSSVAAREIEQYASSVALVLESYGQGYAWLEPETITDPEPDDALYWPTQCGRDYLARLDAERALFGREL